jgi:AcrR family transcriptional regulator
MSAPGLRERKKQKTRWAIQEHAMRLFAQQGYDETTVEQIAGAAEISPSTFFRYFKTKEDVVVQDRYDDLIVEAIVAAPPELTPLQAIRHAFGQMLTTVDSAELEQSFQRGRLVLSHPALRARSLQTMLETTEGIAAAFARRLGRDPADRRVRALAGACIGAVIDGVIRWIDSETDLATLGTLIDEAIDVVEHGI